MDYEQLTRKHALGPFTIQRRENTRFSENKYFSAASRPRTRWLSCSLILSCAFKNDSSQANRHRSPFPRFRSFVVGQAHDQTVLLAISWSPA